MFAKYNCKAFRRTREEQQYFLKNFYGDFSFAPQYAPRRALEQKLMLPTFDGILLTI